MNQTLYNVKTSIGKEAPNILTGIGVAGLLTTTVLAVRATPKALELIEAEAYRHKIHFAELEPLEILRVAWRPYIPAGIVGVVTIACILSANSINLKRNAALAGLYTIASESLRDYQIKVIDTIGKKKELAIRDELAQDKLNANPLGERELIIAGGDALFYDSLSGRYFRSTVEKVRKSQNDFNMELLTDMFKSSNDWFDMINLPPIDMGDAQGWDIENGMLDIQYSTKLADNNEPCIVLGYAARPKYC